MRVLFDVTVELAYISSYGTHTIAMWKTILETEFSTRVSVCRRFSRSACCSRERGRSVVLADACVLCPLYLSVANLRHGQSNIVSDLGCAPCSDITHDSATHLLVGVVEVAAPSWPTIGPPGVAWRCRCGQFRPIWQQRPQWPLMLVVVAGLWLGLKRLRSLLLRRPLLPRCWPLQPRSWRHQPM